MHGEKAQYAREADALASLPKSGRPHKVTLKIYALIFQQVLKYPRLTAQELKVKKLRITGRCVSEECPADAP